MKLKNKLLVNKVVFILFSILFLPLSEMFHNVTQVGKEYLSLGLTKPSMLSYYAQNSNICQNLSPLLGLDALGDL